MSHKIVEVNNKKEYKQAMDKYLSMGYKLVDKKDYQGSTLLVFDYLGYSSNKKRRYLTNKSSDLVKTTKAWGIVHLLIDIIIMIGTFIGICVLTVYWANRQIEAPAAMIGWMTGLLLLFYLSTPALILAAVGLKKVKRNVLWGKGFGVANIIFLNLIFGIYLIKIFKREN